MITGRHLLISVRPKYTRLILSGEKTVELRKQRPKIVPQSIVWVYKTEPEGALIGYFCVKSIEAEVPSKLWVRLKHRMGVTSAEFDSYFKDRELAVAITFQAFTPLVPPIPLRELRRLIPGFRPPQGFVYLTADQVGCIVPSLVPVPRQR